MVDRCENNKRVDILGVIVGLRNKSLPKHGWIQSCYFCSTPTSRIEILQYKSISYHVFRCKECRKHTLED